MEVNKEKKQIKISLGLFYVMAGTLALLVCSVIICIIYAYKTSLPPETNNKVVAVYETNNLL